VRSGALLKNVKRGWTHSAALESTGLSNKQDERLQVAGGDCRMPESLRSNFVKTVRASPPNGRHDSGAMSAGSVAPGVPNETFGGGIRGILRWTV
jgi:hypothetical protein